MSALSRETAKTVLINGLRYPLAAPVERSQLATYIRKFTVGDAQFDSDDYQSALILANFSGGIGIEDSDEGADTSRFWFAVMDSRSPRMLALPPLVTATKPSGASGTARPLGVIGTQFYCCFADVAYGWKDSTGDWHSTANDLDYDPVAKPVNFDGNVWIPQGANGVRSVTETTAGTGTLTEANITANPKAVSLAIWANRLYALTTDGYLYYLIQGSTSWTQVANSAGTNLRINTGDTPKTLVTYADRQGSPTLWAITDRAAYLFYESEVEWVPSNIKFPPHPDFGRAAAVWRTGEDLWISAASDIVRQTTGNAIVPMASGISRDQGLPQEYRGTIYDLEPEISNLYALVGGAATVPGWGYATKVSGNGSGNGQFNTPRGLAFSAYANQLYVADKNNDRVQRFDTDLVYAGQFAVAAGDPVAIAAKDDTGDLYVVFSGSHAGGNLADYDALGTPLGTFSTGTNHQDPRAVAVHQDTGDVYVCDGTANTVHQYSSAGTLRRSWTLGGTTPIGVVADATRDIVSVLCSGTLTVEQYTGAGTLIRSWSIGGAYDGQVTSPRSLALHPQSGDLFIGGLGLNNTMIHQYTPAGLLIRNLATSGTGDGAFTLVEGLALSGSGALYAADDATTDRVQKLTLSAGADDAIPTLHAWSQVGWHCLWAGPAAVPTWATVSAPTTHYRLWWGMDDGNAYYTTLYRGFENVNQARIASSTFFAPSGFLLTSKFDAGMLGFRKLASHVVAIPVEDSITSSETFTIEFSIDEGGWETLGTVNSTTLDATTNEARFSFGASGRKFNTIRFRVTGERRSGAEHLSPMLRSLTLLFNKIPPPARSFVFTIAPGAGDAGEFGRTPQTMFQELDDLAVSDSFFDIEYNGLSFPHCRLASVTGQDGISENAGRRVVSVIELPVGIAA